MIFYEVFSGSDDDDDTLSSDESRVVVGYESSDCMPVMPTKRTAVEPLRLSFELTLTLQCKQKKIQVLSSHWRNSAIALENHDKIVQFSALGRNLVDHHLLHVQRWPPAASFQSNI